MEKNELKKLLLKIACYYFDTIIKIEDFDFGNISLDENYENILFHTKL